MSPKQKQIVNLARSQVDNIFYKSEAVRLLEGAYYRNASKYVGEILSNMVKKGYLERLKNGIYRLVRTDSLTIEETRDQLKLF